MNNPRKNGDQNSLPQNEKPNLSKKRQLHRRTQSNSDFSASNHSDTHLRLSTPQHIDKGLIKNPALTETNLAQAGHSETQIQKKNNEDKQVIIETLDLTPQEQLKMAGTAGYGTINPGFFKFGKKRTLDNCPKYLELMMNLSSSNVIGGSEEEKKANNDLLEIDVSPLKEHNRNISINYNKINEESMETESEISKMSKRSSICVRLSISKQKKDSSAMKSDIIEAIEELLIAEDGNKLKLYRSKLKKKGHSKSCFSFNLHAFNLKLRNFIENKKSVSIRKNEILYSDSISKLNSSNNNSMINFSAHRDQNLRKKSDESLMVNKLNSSITKHKKTSTSVFSTKLKNNISHDKRECMIKIHEYDQKIKDLEKKIFLLQEKTDNLECENKSLSTKIIDVSNEKKAGDLEKDDYKKTIKEMEKRIKNNENNIKKILNLMVQTDSTGIPDWRNETSINSFSQLEISIFSPRGDGNELAKLEKSILDDGSSSKVLSISETPKNLINLINAGNTLNVMKKSSIIRKNDQELHKKF